MSQTAQRGDEGVFERRFVDAGLVDRMPRGSHGFFQNAFCLDRLAYQKIEMVAESLRVQDFAILSADLRKRPVRFAQVWSVEFKPFCVEAGPKLVRRADLPDLTQVHQRHPMTPLGFVQVRSGHEQRETVGRQMSQSVPELAA